MIRSCVRLLRSNNKFQSRTLRLIVVLSILSLATLLIKKGYVKVPEYLKVTVEKKEIHHIVDISISAQDSIHKKSALIAQAKTTPEPRRLISTPLPEPIKPKDDEETNTKLPTKTKKEQKCKIPQLNPYDSDILPYLKKPNLQNCLNKEYGVVTNDTLCVKAPGAKAVFLFYINRINDFKFDLNEKHVLLGSHSKLNNLFAPLLSHRNCISRGFEISVRIENWGF